MAGLVLAGVLGVLLAVAAAQPFVGVLVWSWISFMNPHREVWGFAQTLPWAMLAFLVTIFGCVVAREPKRPAVNAVTVLLLMFAICITVTSFTALAPADAVWAKWDRTIKVLLGLLLTAALLTSKRRIDAMIWLMVISLGFYGVKGGLFTLMTGGSFIVLGPDSTMITDRNHLAVALLVAIPLMNYLRLQTRHSVVKWVMLFAMISTLFAVVGSQSRGALVALLATALLLWFRSPGKILSGLGIAAAVAVAILFMPHEWVERMNSISSYEEDASAMGRINIWRAATMLALMRPLVGGGFLGFYQQAVVDTIDPSIMARAAHSIWFETLGEHGFPAFFIWAGILLAGTIYTVRITRATRDRPELRWAFDFARMAQVSIVAYCSGGSFLSLSYWDLFWTLLVVIAAARSLVAKAVDDETAAVSGSVQIGWRSRDPSGVGPPKPAWATHRAIR